MKLIWPCLIVLYPRAEPCSVTFELLLELSIAFLTLSLAPLGSRLCPSDVAHPGFLQVVLSGKICQLVALPICAKGSRGTQVDLITVLTLALDCDAPDFFVATISDWMTTGAHVPSVICQSSGCVWNHPVAGWHWFCYTISIGLLANKRAELRHKIGTKGAMQN